MILILAGVCAYASVVLFAIAFVRTREARLARSFPPVRIEAAPAANENARGAATRRFVAVDLIAACRDSVNRASTRRVRASFIEASVSAELLSRRESSA